MTFAAGLELKSTHGTYPLGIRVKGAKDMVMVMIVVRVWVMIIF